MQYYFLDLIKKTKFNGNDITESHMVQLVNEKVQLDLMMMLLLILILLLLQHSLSIFEAHRVANLLL